eukprot:6191909-Pleurochrysis_carterae.AAC.3
MPSRNLSFLFVCTVAVFVPVSHVYLAHIRPLCSEFPVSERMADVAIPCAPDRRPPAGAASPRACDRSLASTC